MRVCETQTDVFRWASLIVAIAALISSVSSAEAGSVCYNAGAPDYSSAGSICVDVQPYAYSRVTNGYVGPSLTGGSPQQSYGPLAVSGMSGGTGDSASGSASAAFGAVHLYADSKAEAGDQIVQAISESYASYSDKFTVNVSTYVTFRSTLEGGFAGNGYATSQVRLFDLNGVSDLLSPTLSYFDINQFQSTETQFRQVYLHAGDTYFLYYSAQAYADSIFPHGIPTPDSYLESTADLSNTGLLYIDPLAGRLTTLSGHDYSTPTLQASVPEPSTWAMMIIGFAGLGFMAHRKRERLLSRRSL